MRNIQNGLSSQKIVVVGLAPRYYYEQTSLDNALQNALDKSAKLQYSIVKGGQTFIQTPDGISIVEDSLYIHIFENENFPRNFFNKYSVVDTFSSQDFIALCYARKNSNKDINAQLIAFDEECEWVNEIPEDEGYSYAVGSCDRLGSELKSWERAENQAILNLARQRSMEKYVEELVSDGTRMSKTIENINIELQSIEIIERWKNEKNNIYFVLVRIRK